MTGLRISVAVHAHQRLIGEALAGYLSGRPEFAVVGHTVEWPDLVTLCGLGPPDAVVVDLDTDLSDALDWFRRFNALFPSVRMLVTYGSLTPQELSSAVEAGISALVPYARGIAALLHPLRRAPTPVRRSADGGRLTGREREILVLMSSGHNVAEMATLLDISPRTVESHKRRIYTKLDATSQARAVARAAALGVLDRRPTANRRGPERAAATHVVVCGPPGCLVDDVMNQVLATDPLIAERAEGPQMWRRLPEWRSRRSVTVLVAPTPLDWRFAALLDAPLVLVPAPDGGAPDVALARAAAVVPPEHIARDIAAVVTVVASGYLVVDTTHRLDSPWGPPELSGREREILRSVALGETVRQTARSLGIATKTVENLQSRLYRKLGVRNRAAALAVAYDLGLVDVTDQAQ